MHDDDGLENTNPLVLRHFEDPVSVRELLHSTLDRLLDTLITNQETIGAASVTVLGATGATNDVFGGKTIFIALDLDPQNECTCGECEGLSRDGE